MTRTETDLRAVFADRADTAPPPGRVLHRLQRPAPEPPRRRRAIVLAGAGVAAAAVAGTLVATSLAGGPDRSQFSGGIASRTHATTPASLTITALGLAREPAGYALQSRTVTTSRTTLVFSAGRAAGALAGTPDAVDADAYARGTFDATTVQRGTRTTVNGHPAWFGRARGRVIDAGGLESTRLTPSLAWAIAPDTWVVVHGVRPDQRTQAAALAVARALQTGAKETVRVPVTVDYLPAPLAATSIGFDPSMPGASMSFAGGGRTVRIEVGHVERQSVRAIFAGPAPLRVAGHPAKLDTLSTGHQVDGHQLTLVLDQWVVTVSGNTRVTTAELRSIAEHLAYATHPTQPATWFPARTALA